MLESLAPAAFRSSSATEWRLRGLFRSSLDIIIIIYRGADDLRRPKLGNLTGNFDSQTSRHQQASDETTKCSLERQKIFSYKLVLSDINKFAKCKAERAGCR